MNEPIDYGIYYRSWHDDSDEHAETTSVYMAKLLAPFLNDIDRSSQVLEIGCGMGFALLGLQKLGFEHIYGIDLDRSQVEACQRRGLPVELLSDSIVFLKSHQEKYKLVVLLDVLEHLPCSDQIPLMKAILLSLQEGGMVVLQVPNANSILASRWRYNDFTHHSSFTEHSLRFVLLNAGFSSVEIKKATMPRPSLRLWRPSARTYFWKWAVRRFWRKVLEVELGDEGLDIPIELNLMAVAYK